MATPFRDTATGKGLEDLLWFLLYVVGFALFSGILSWLTANQVQLMHILGPWGSILVPGVVKALSYYIDRLRDPKVPNL